METAFLSLMKGLLARGHQPTAIVSGWTDGELSRLLDQAGIPNHQVPLGRFYVRNPVFTWHTLRRMPAARRQLRAIAADGTAGLGCLARRADAVAHRLDPAHPARAVPAMPVPSA